MAIGIMRVEKRGRASVRGLELEANRTIEDHEQGRDFDNSDIDWTETNNNIYLVKTDGWNKEITRRIKKEGVKERKNSVVMLDGLYTASQEFFQDKTAAEIVEYFQKCIDYHTKTFCQGDITRVVNAVIHLDEETPHLHIASVPIYEDEKGMHLSAREIMGNRSDYHTRQDSFYKDVSMSFGLERGEVYEPGKAKLHTTKREWQLSTQEKLIKQSKKELKQAVERVSRANDKAQKAELQAEKASQKAVRLKEEIFYLEDAKNRMIDENSKIKEYGKNLYGSKQELARHVEKLQMQASELRSDSEELSNKIRVKQHILEATERELLDIKQVAFSKDMIKVNKDQLTNLTNKLDTYYDQKVDLDMAQNKLNQGNEQLRREKEKLKKDRIKLEKEIEERERTIESRITNKVKQILRDERIIRFNKAWDHGIMDFFIDLVKKLFDFNLNKKDALKEYRTWESEKQEKQEREIDEIINEHIIKTEYDEDIIL